MAIKDDDLLYVQRPTGVDAGGYKITAGDLLSGAGGGGSSVTVDETAPLNPAEGDLWWADSDVTEGGGRLYVWTGDEWVDTSLPGGGSDSSSDLWTEGAGAIYPTTLTNSVGIGTDTPLQLLHVRGDSDPQVKVSATNTGTNSAGLIFENEGQRNWQIWADRGADCLSFGRNSRSSTDVVIKSNGNLGIGNGNPDHKLDVDGGVLGTNATNANGTGRFAGTTGTNYDQLKFEHKRLSDGTDWTTAAYKIFRKVDGTNKNYIQFGFDNLEFGYDNTLHMLLDNSGNLGINTDAPNSKLEVVGDSALKGAVWMGRHKNSFPGNANDLPGCFIEDAAGGSSIHLSRTDNTPLFLNTNIDTAIARFKKGGVEKGTITIDDNGVNFSGKLQGLYADQFVRADADDSVTGRIRFEGGQNTFGNNTDGGQGAAEVVQFNSNADAFMSFHISNRMAGYFGLDNATSDLFWGGWSVGDVKHRVAHMGNIHLFPVVKNYGDETVNGEKTFNNNIFFTNGRGFFDQGLNIGTRNTGSFPGVDNADTGGRLHHSNDSGCFVAFSRSNGEPLVTNRTGTNGNVISIRKNGAAKGGIEVNDSNIIITGQASDYRIKKDITPMPSAVEDIKAMRLINFVYTDRGHGETHEGFIAHELQEIVPGAVTRHKDAVDGDGKPDLQGIDYSKLIPKLTKALQEALERIEILEEKLNGTT